MYTWKCDECGTEFETRSESEEDIACPHCGEEDGISFVPSETDKKIEKSEYQRMQDEYGVELYPD